MRKRKTMAEMQEKLSAKHGDVEILSVYREDGKTYCEMVCHKDGFKWVGSYANILAGNGCRVCSKKYKPTVDEVKQIFKANGYTPLFDEYKNYTSPSLLVLNSDGYKSEFSLASLNRGCNISPFASYNKHTIENIKHYLKTNRPSLKLLSKKYIKQKEKLEFLCNEGHEFKMSLDHMLSGEDCPYCYSKNRCGEGHPNYNPNLTEEDRDRNRLYKEGGNGLWVKTVYAKDNFTCQICGEKRHLNAHHLDGYHWAKEKRLELLNGVTLCEDCHKLFHKTYGYRLNTKEQFLDFKQNIK